MDHYDDTDWSALWWVRVSGPATVHPPDDPERAAVLHPLIVKYPQYRQSPPAGPTYSLAIESLTWWRASA